MEWVTSQPAGEPAILDFRAETPLHRAAAEFFEQALAQSWPDPGKLHPESRELAIYLSRAKSAFAGAWGVGSDWIHFTSDPQQAFSQLILGNLAAKKINGAKGTNPTLFLRPTDRQQLQRVANSLAAQGERISDFSTEPHNEDLAIWQLINPELGFALHQPPANADLLVDATAPGMPNLRSLTNLPNFYGAVTTARSWQGPAGFGVVVLNPKANWSSPWPGASEKFAPNFSPLLALLAALAFEASNAEAEIDYVAMKRLLAQSLKETGYQIVGRELGAMESNSPVISIQNSAIDSERAVSSLIRLGIYLDGGSACSPNFDSSHVLRALGLSPIGQLRLRLNKDLQSTDIKRLANALSVLN